MRSTKSMHWAILAAALFAAAPAHADNDRARAKAQFIAGQHAFEVKDYAGALEHFRQAFKLHRYDAVRFNIAVCLERLGKNREAVAQYLAASKSDELNAATRRRASEKAAQARKQLGTLSVDGTPKGADVLVDGEELCNLPCKVELDPGAHRVVVQDGRLSEQRKVWITKQNTRRVSIALGPATRTPAKVTGPALAPVRHDEHTPTAPPSSSGGPGWLTWAGAGVMVLGGAGIAVFGTKAKSDHDQWVATGAPAARSDGLRARDLANVSIGVAALGAIAIGIDLLLLGPHRAHRIQTGSSQGIGFAF